MVVPIVFSLVTLVLLLSYIKWEKKCKEKFGSITNAPDVVVKREDRHFVLLFLFIFLTLVAWTFYLELDPF
ncbi:MAG: hypothetical protein LiPW41_365 [Parcubacteria group bacterium LiPW_41]|nr:MAG: hypothetical protein LiPW41_365 [Parcubacteria group bacterium LiPW_41]